MIGIKSLKHPFLNEHVLKKFAQNKIHTMLDFLQEDNDKLVAISKLTIQQITNLRNDLISNYSAPLINGTCFLQRTLNTHLKTHLINLDLLLGGGIPIGYITEVCGLADSGKTQLCVQIAINIANDDNNTVLYIDTKGDFSAIKIQQILDAYGHSHKSMASIMCRIKVIHVWTMEELVNLISNIKNKTLSIENLSLIIIDSLPNLMFQFLGDENKIGLTMLNKLVNNLRFLAKGYYTGIICVNIETRWVEQDLIETEDSTYSSISTTNISYEKKNRCLGRYWHFIPAVIMVLEKTPTEQYKSQINVTLTRSLQVQDHKMCILNMCSAGIK